MKLEEAADITFGLKEDWNRESAAKQRLISKVGPNDWDNIQPEDFGPEQDFDLDDHGSLWVFWAISNAALQWCYKHLPEDCPRWGKGFAIEARYIADIVKGAREDGLMNKVDWEEANEEAANLAVQWEES